MADPNQTEGASGGGSADPSVTADTQAGSPSDGGISAPHGATYSAPAAPAAAPCAMSTALLRQMAEATQAIAASTANIVARVAALEQAQQGQGQQQQACQPQPSIGPFPGPSPLAAAQPLSWPPGVLGAQPLQGLPEQTQLAAATAAIKANARLAAEVWRSMAGTKYFIARGSFSVAEPLTPDILGFILKEVASVSPASTKQLQHLAELAVQDFFPPAPVGETPVAMPADMHFRTFLAAFGAVLEYGMGSAPAICKTRFTLRKQELDAVLTQLQAYLQYHYVAIHPYPAQVRAALLPAINAGIDVYMHELAKQAGALWNEHPHMPPPAGSGPPAAHPSFTGLKALLVEGSADSLAERAQNWKSTAAKTAGAGAGKRKAAEKPGGSKANPGQGRTIPTEGNRAFKARLVEWETPAGVCEYAWRGDTCPRSACRYAHDQVAPAVGQAAQAPPPATPSPPLSLPQRQQQAPTAGGGAAATGGSTPSTSLVRFSRSHAAAGRGGGPAGAGAGRGSGGTRT
eukprot:jgi/Undpi1/10894/HiC_scaffold_3.g01420.m1